MHILGFKSVLSTLLEIDLARGPETLTMPIPLCPIAEAIAQIVFTLNVT